MTAQDARDGTVAHTPFLVDNATFLVYFVIGKGEGVGPVVKDEQARIDHRFASHRHVGYIVYCFVGACVGIEVISELHTDALEPSEEFLVGEVLGTVEAHVLQEVGKTVLLFVFLYGANLLGNVEVGLSLWKFVVTDVV